MEKPHSAKTLHFPPISLAAQVPGTFVPGIFAPLLLRGCELAFSDMENDRFQESLHFPPLSLAISVFRGFPILGNCPSISLGDETPFPDMENASSSKTHHFLPYSFATWLLSRWDTQPSTSLGRSIAKPDMENDRPPKILPFLPFHSPPCSLSNWIFSPLSLKASRIENGTSNWSNSENSTRYRPKWRFLTRFRSSPFGNIPIAIGVKTALELGLVRFSVREWGSGGVRLRLGGGASAPSGRGR